MPHTDSAFTTLLANLTDEQRLAATVDGDVCVIAGAGTGKTTTMCARIVAAVQAGRADPARVLAVTHSRRAAGEMRERILRLGVDGPRVRTFHSAAFAQLAAAGAAPKLLASPHRLVRDLLGSAAKAGRRGDDDCVVDVVAEISWAQTMLLDPSTYAAEARRHGRQPPLDLAVIARTWERYERAKAAEGLQDFADVLLCAARTGFDGHWDLVVVDEYQDTDPAQQQLFDLWAGSTAERAVVGDPRQAIYGFKGASARFLDEFAARPDATVVHLTRNFRSTVEVCDTANRLQPHLPALVGGGHGPGVDVVAAADEQEEERRVVAAIERWHRSGTPYEEIAVLARYRSATARFEAALTRAHIPYNTGGDDRFFDQADVKSVLQEFARRAKAAPDEPGAAMLRTIAEQFGWVRDEPPAGEGARRRRWELHTALVEMVERIPSVETLAAQWLLDELVVRFREAHVPAPPGVSLLTAHSAKGLEWDAVAVVGATDGAFPSSYATTAAQEAEERNLFYVALTRARRDVVVSHPQRRNNRPARRSRYLDVIEPTVSAAAPRRRAGATSGSGATVAGAATSAVPASGGCRTCGTRLVGAAARRLGVCSAHLSGDAAVVAAKVRAWAASEAERLGRSASSICPDQALLAIVVAPSHSACALSEVPRLDTKGTDLDALSAALGHGG